MESKIVSVETSSSSASIERHLGYWLRRVSNQVSATFAKALQERGLSVAEWVVLSQVHDRPGVKPGEVADALGMTRGAISKVLDKLEEKGWVTRRTLPEDQRVQLLSLTRQGRRLLPQLVEIADRNDSHFFACLDDAERVRLWEVLRKLTEFHGMRATPIE